MQKRGLVCVCQWGRLAAGAAATCAVTQPTPTPLFARPRQLRSWSQDIWRVEGRLPTFTKKLFSLLLLF